jgi:hypothetical protein
MRTFARLAMNRTHAACGEVVMAVGMAILCAVAPTAHAQGITAVAGGPFRNAPFIAQSSQFTVEFDATPTGTDNAGVGLSDDPTGAFNGTSVFVRFNPSGKIDARNGAAFSAAAAISYVSGLSYHFREDVDVVNHIIQLPSGCPGKHRTPSR